MQIQQDEQVESWNEDEYQTQESSQNTSRAIQPFTEISQHQHNQHETIGINRTPTNKN